MAFAGPLLIAAVAAFATIVSAAVVTASSPLFLAVGWAVFALSVCVATRLSSNRHVRVSNSRGEARAVIWLNQVRRAVFLAFRGATVAGAARS